MKTGKKFAEFKDWDAPQLIRRFENDMIYDAHGYTARFERSRACQELVLRGLPILRPVVEHLRSNPPSDFMDLRRAWNHLLNLIEVRYDPKRTGPESLLDTEGWIAWAESMSG